MATTSSQLRIAELDYDQVLGNLIAFMKADPTFADYDFSGSGLRLIARVLAYVTYYNAHYLSTAVNESFLDTAQLRSSVVSHARMLGYESKGTRSAIFTTNVSVEIANTASSLLTLPKNTQFVLRDNAQIVFYTTSDYTLVKDVNDVYRGTNVTLTEGYPAQYRFIVDVNDPTQRFIIPNANVNLDTMAVTVYDSVTSNVATPFVRASNPDLLLIGPNDPVFFVREAYDGYAELTFGNGIAGKALTQGNLIVVDYFVSSGSAGNNIRGPFRINNSVIDGLQLGVTADPDSNTLASSGGADPESLDQIRYLAPLSYQTQNRCVTAEDYKAVILDEYGPQIDAITVFGGEQGDPNDPSERPVYGRVYIALKPTTGLRFTEYTRNLIENSVIRPHNIVGVVPEVIDPDYTYLGVNTLVRYDNKVTTRSKSQLVDAVANSVTTYAQQNFQKFNSSFRFSRLARAIDDTDAAITSSVTQLRLQKRIFPRLGENNTLTLKFGAAIYKNGDNSAILTTNRFSYLDPTLTPGSDPVGGCFLREQNGIVQVVQTIPATTRTMTLAADGAGTYRVGEKVYQGATLATASAVGTVVKWDAVKHVLVISTVTGVFKVSDIVRGVTSKAEWVVLTTTNPNLDTVKILQSNAGTVDYAMGIIRLSNFAPYAIANNAPDIRIDVVPLYPDFTTNLNRMLLLNTDALTITVVDDASPDMTLITAFYQGGVLQ